MLRRKPKKRTTVKDLGTILGLPMSMGCRCGRSQNDCGSAFPPKIGAAGGLQSIGRRRVI